MVLKNIFYVTAVMKRLRTYESHIKNLRLLGVDVKD